MSLLLRKTWSRFGLRSGRAMSSLVDLQTDENNIMTMKLNRPPVNSLGLEFMKDIISSIDAVEKEAKGLVLTSANKSIFCAGLDLQEMYKPDEQRYTLPNVIEDSLFLIFLATLTVGKCVLFLFVGNFYLLSRLTKANENF